MDDFWTLDPSFGFVADVVTPTTPTTPEYAVELDGVDDYLVADNQASINFAGDFTVLMYFDGNAAFNGARYPVLLYKTTGTLGYIIQQHVAGFDIFSPAIEDGSRYIPTMTGVNMAAQLGPHVLGIGRTGDVPYGFFDGSRVAGPASSSADLTSSTQLIIGNYTTGGDPGGAASGQLRAMAMWSRLLSAAEAEAFPGTVPASGLVAHWPFTEGSGSTVADIVGGATLTINGATWVPLA